MSFSSSLSDHELARRLRTGDARVFEVFFRRHGAMVLRFALSLTRDSHVAEDVVQEVFGGIWTRRTTWPVPDDVLAYLVGAARKSVLHRLRTTQSRAQATSRYVSPGESPALGESPMSPDALTEQIDQAGHIWNVVMTLPEPRRTILLCRWVHGMDWSAIAAHVGLSPDAAKKQHARALIALRPRLKNLAG